MSDPVEYRLGERPDPEAICALRESVGYDAARSDYPRAYDGYFTTVAAYQEDELIGWIAIVSDEVRHGFIVDVFVHPAHQRRGVGKELVSRAVAEGSSRGLFLFHADFASENEGFYQTCGFQIGSGAFLDFAQSSDRVVVVRATNNERDNISALLDDYLREHAAHREIQVGATSSATYPYLDLYWSESGRVPFLIHARDEIVGFALICDPQATASGRHQIAEFYIRPENRRRGSGRAAIRQIWDQFPGEWELSVLHRNSGARAFWTSCIRLATGQDPEIAEVQYPDGWRASYEFNIA